MGKRKTKHELAPRNCFIDNVGKCDCFLPSQCKLKGDKANERQAAVRQQKLERLRAARRERSEV